MSDLQNRFVTLLRWSEKYTKTDMVYVARGGAWFGLGTGLSWAISFCTALAFANLISKDTFGTYQYVLSVMGMFSILTLPGMGTAVARGVAQGKDGSLFDGLRAKIRWGLLGGFGAIAFGAYYIVQGNPSLGWAFVIAGIFIPFWEAPGLYLNYAQGKKRFDISNAYDASAQALAALAVIGALVVSKNLLIILASYFLGWSIGRTFLFWLTLKKIPPNSEPDHEAIAYGKHLTLMSTINRVSVNLDTVVLWHMLGPAPVAAYIFAQALPLRIAGLTKAIDRIAFPKMAEKEMAVLQETLLPKVLILSGVAALMAVAYIFAAPYLFQLFFPNYMESVPLTQILSLFIVLQPLSVFLNPLTAHAKQKLLYTYNAIIPVLRILIFLLLIPPFGVLGAVLGLVIMKALDGGLLALLFYRA